MPDMCYFRLLIFDCEKLLCVTIDAKLSFEKHIEKKIKNFSKICSFHDHLERESTDERIFYGSV